MKWAASIRYAGQLIDAVDCDYQDYKRLGLLCPNCKDPVFLQGESSRSRGDRVVAVPAHFKHFAVRDPALAKQCESRVAKYDRAELIRRAASARNQRLKLLQRWFWTIFTNSNRSLYLVRDGVPEPPLMAEKETLAENFIKFIRGTPIKEVEGYLERSIQHLVGFDLDKLGSESVKQKIKNLSKLDLKFHKLICLEVMQFLISKANRGLAEKAINAAWFMVQNAPSVLSMLKVGADPIALVFFGLVEAIAIINRSEEFAKSGTHSDHAKEQC